MLLDSLLVVEGWDHCGQLGMPLDVLNWIRSRKHRSWYFLKFFEPLNQTTILPQGMATPKFDTISLGGVVALVLSVAVFNIYSHASYKRKSRYSAVPSFNLMPTIPKFQGGWDGVHNTQGAFVLLSQRPQVRIPALLLSS